MSQGEIAVLSLIIAAFAAFGLTLAWLSLDWLHRAPRRFRAPESGNRNVEPAGSE